MVSNLIVFPHKVMCLLLPWKGFVVPHCSCLCLAGPQLCLDVSFSAALSSGLITQGLEIRSHHRLIFSNKKHQAGL